MRHDSHFVDEVSTTRTAPETVGQMIDLDLLDANPNQPRRSMGDLSDLISSIKEKGLLEPVLVRKTGTRFQIIAGERRYHASRAAGLRQIPCIEMEVDERGVMEISLIENLQRRDLTPFEESDAVLRLCEEFAYTHDKVAQKLGKSRSSVTELLSIARIPEEVREICRRADISSKSLLIEIARRNTVEEMMALASAAGTDRLSRDDARRMKAGVPQSQHPEARPVDAVRPFTFRFHSPERRFSVNLKFEQSEIRKDEIVQALRDLIHQIEASDHLPA
jgi:ParB family chromosome partitioning protein